MKYVLCCIRYTRVGTWGGDTNCGFRDSLTSGCNSSTADGGTLLHNTLSPSIWWHDFPSHSETLPSYSHVAPSQQPSLLRYRNSTRKASCNATFRPLVPAMMQLYKDHIRCFLCQPQFLLLDYVDMGFAGRHSVHERLHQLMLAVEQSTCDTRPVRLS